MPKIYRNAKLLQKKYETIGDKALVKNANLNVTMVNIVRNS
jgi:hypothetical protein